MRLPHDSLKKCQELIPELNMGIQIFPGPLNGEGYALINEIPLKDWALVLRKMTECFQILDRVLEITPDLKPYWELNESIENVGALLHCLSIFHECMMKNE